MKVIIVGLGRMGTGLSLNLMIKGHQVTIVQTKVGHHAKAAKVR